MDATIAAAWIGAGVGGVIGIAGTVAASVVGSRSTRRATERTVEAGTGINSATLLAAHEAWLRDKRAAAYVEALADLAHRRFRREHDLTRGQWDEDSEQEAKTMLAAYKPPGFEAEGRILAYGSDAVVLAFEAVNRAEADVWQTYAQRIEVQDSIRSAQTQGRMKGAPDGDPVMDAERKVEAALALVEVTDDALIAIIRNELRSRPEAAMPPTEVPAVRRGLLRRRKEGRG